jgi:hypothetical protein
MRAAFLLTVAVFALAPVALAAAPLSLQEGRRAISEELRFKATAVDGRWAIRGCAKPSASKVTCRYVFRVPAPIADVVCGGQATATRTPAGRIRVRG